jgi:hypothetical protein
MRLTRSWILVALAAALGCGGGSGSHPDGAAAGATGSAGTTGSAGATSAAGTTGATAGTTGSAGAMSPAGSTGTAGATGAAGADGGAGSAGAMADASVATDAPTTSPDAATSTCGSCTAYAAPTLAGHVAATGLDNLSGMAASWKNPGVIFGHNDRNNAQIYAMGPDGSPRARYVLTGAAAVDPEDLGVGPCPAGTCLFLADIGDNAASRASIAIFRVTEPTVPAAATGDVSVTFDRFAVTYEDGAHNAEGLLVEPKTGALYVVTKPAMGQASSVYRLPHPLAAGMNQAVKVATLPIPKATDKQASAAAAHPCGRGFVVRTYDKLYEFRIAPGAAFETAFAAAPVAIPWATEPQSEAVSYLPDGTGILSSGEGVGAPLERAGCAP